MKSNYPPTVISVVTASPAAEYILARMARIVASLAMRRPARHINPRRQGGYHESLIFRPTHHGNPTRH
jgi:hypothetical protein